jgi:tRNA 2-thiouridine synthesizing protein E
MPDIRHMIENPDTSSPERADRELTLQDWSEEQARRTAAEEGLELTEEHWEVVHLLREHYLEHGLAEKGRELGDLLDERFADRGGRRHLRRLFPNGPVTQGMRIGGLPLPRYTRDEGFGTAR